MNGHTHSAPFPHLNRATWQWEYTCGCGRLLRCIDAELAAHLRAYLPTRELLAEYGSRFAL
jgi:hypothetical protein